VENKDQNSASVGYGADGVSSSVSEGIHLPPSDVNSLSADPEDQPLFTSQEQPKARGNVFLRFARRLDVILGVLLVIGLAVAGYVYANRSQGPSNSESQKDGYGTISIPLEELVAGKDLTVAGASNVTINGPLQLTNSFSLAPTLQPTGAKAGQIYYDQTTNQLAYFNGTNFVFLTSPTPASGGLQSLGGATGQLTLGSGLNLSASQLSNSGVLSVQGESGDVTFTAGPGLVINGTTFSNSGVLSLAAGTPNVTVDSDGNGNLTLSVATSGGGGTGTVTSSGAVSAGTIPLFTSSQNIEGSIISQSGFTVTISGDLSVVTGGLSLSNALTVPNGGTGAASLAANGVLVGQGTAAITSVTSGGAGLCLLSTAGAPTWAACPTGSGVTSLNGLTGGLSIANASAAGSTITIDNASTTTKGIASFNSTNFNVTSGAVNTIQDINSGATPTFAGVNTNTITPNAALTVGVSAQTALLQGSTTTITSNGAGNDITLNSANAINLLDNTFVSGDITTTGNIAVNGGNITSTGALNITPGGALTLGSTTQALTLQGGATTSMRATSGANTTIVAFTNPVANTTLNFPALSAGTYTICTSNGNCAGAGVTLQAAYNNSSTPEITLDATRGALTIRDNSTPIGGNLFEVQNNAGSATYLAVTSSGAAVTGTVTSSGSINSSAGALQTNGITRVDNSGNLVNIAAITASGNASLQGGNITLGTNAQAGAIVLNDGSFNTGTLQVAALGQNTVYLLPDAGAGTATICLTTGNCAGTGGGVTTSGGTTNKLAKFTAGQAIGDSSITDNGATVTTTGNVVIQGGSATIGIAGTQSGTLFLAYGGGAFSFSGSVATDTLTANQNYLLPNASGTFCLTSGNCAGVGGTGDILQGGNNFGTALTIGTNDNFAFNLETNGTNRMTIANDGSQITFGSNLDLILQGATAFISNSQGQTNSEAFGLNATTTGGNAVAVGNGAAAVANGVSVGRSAGVSSGAFGGPVAVGDSANAGAWGVAVGQGSSTTGNNSVAIGNGATAAQDAVALGMSSNAMRNGIALGYGAVTGGNDRIVIGHNATATADNQLVIGSGDTFIDNAYIGNGVSNAAPVDTTIHATGGSGTDVGGGDLNLAGGAGTGSATGGNLNFQVATPGGSGSSANVPATVASLSGTNGSALFKNLVNSVNAFQVQTAGGAAVLTVDTTTNGTVLAGDLAVNGGDLTSTGALNITPGGTLTVGVTGQQLILQGSANTRLTATGNGFTTTVGFTGTATGAVTYNFDRAAAAGTYNICTSIGNCAGAGGGVTTSGGTTGAIAKFTGSQTLGDSLLSESGSIVTVNGNLNLTSGHQFTVNGTQISSADLSNDANLAKLSASQTFTGNTVAFQNGTNSTNAFNIQNAAGNRVVTADTTNGRLTLGTASALSGTLVFQNMTNANTVTIIPGTPTGNRTLTLPDASGIICTDSGNCAGAGATLQTGYNFSVGGTTPKIKVNSTLLGVDIQDADTTIGANLFNIRSSNAAGLGSVLFGVGSTGSVTVQNSANSTTAFRLLTAGGTTVLTGDTTNGQITLGQSSTLSGALLFSNASNTNQVTLSAPTATANRAISLPDEAGTVCIQNSANCGFALSTGNNNYVQNQNSTNQTADFRISGTGRANTSFQAPLYDTATAIALAIGTTNATAINLNQSTTIASGKTLTVTSGATSLTGATTGDALTVSNSTSTGNVAVFNDNSTAVFTIGDDGVMVAKTLSSTSSAFSIQNSSSQTLFSTDTFNNTVHMRTVGRNNTSTFESIWLQGSKNGVTAFIGDNDNTSAYLANDFSGSLRFNGSNVAWGDLGYYPNGGGNGNNGVFRFSTTGSAVSTTPNAKVGVGDLYVNGNAGIGTNNPGYKLDVAGDINISSGSAYRINGTAICTSSGCTPASGSGNYIQNQNASQQTSSNFWISGTGRADTAFTTPRIDTATSGALGVGDANATSVNIGNSGVNIQTTVYGQFLSKPATNSTTVTRVQNAQNESVINVDTTTPNLITNSSFEVQGTTGWAAHGGASAPTQTISAHYDNDNALAVAATAANHGARYNYALAASTQYSFSVFVRTPTAQFSTLQIGYSTDGTTDTSCATAQTVELNNWKRITCTFSTGGSVSGTRYVYIKQTDATSRTWYIDAAQLETASASTVYRNGKIMLNNSVSINSGLLDAAATDAALFVKALYNGNGVVIQGSGQNDLFKNAFDIKSYDNSTSYFNVNDSLRSTQITGGNGFLDSAALNINNAETGSIGLRIKGLASQTSALTVLRAGATPGAGADILQFQDSNSLVHGSFNNIGNQLTLGRIASSGTVSQGKLLLSDGTTDNFAVTLQAATLTASRTITIPDATGTICLQSSSSCGFAAGTAASYIQNQNATQQTASNFWLSGSGRADTSLLSPALDTATSAALSIGTANASSITLGSNTNNTAITLNSGTGAINIGTGTQAHTTSIGTGAAANTVNIGSTNTTSATTVSAGSGGINLITNGASAGVTIKTNTNSSSALQLQNASGFQVFKVDTTASSDLLSNGGFEDNVALNWSQVNGTATTSRVTTTHYAQSAAMRAIISTANQYDGIKYPITLTNSTDYAFSFYAKLISSSAPTPSLVYGYSNDGTIGTEVDCQSEGQPISATGWTRFACTFTTPASHSGTPYIYIEQNEAFAMSLYIDNVTVVQQSTAHQAYYDGAIDMSGAAINGPVSIQNTTDYTPALQIYGAEEIYGNLNVYSADMSKGYRFRTDGSAMDFEVTGSGVPGELWISGWTGPNFTGTQKTFLRMASYADLLMVGSGTASSTPMMLSLAQKSTSGDPGGGLNGSMYYNNNTGKFRCLESGWWRDCMASSRTEYSYSNDMISVAPENGGAVFTSGGATSASAVAGITGHPGIVQLSTSTSATGAAGFGTNDTGQSFLLGNGDYYRHESVLRIPTLSDGTNTFTVRSGLMDGVTTDGTDGCFFKYSNGVNSGKWQGICYNNTASSTCDTTTTVVANTWYRLTVVVNSAGTSADFQVNGVSKCQVSAQIPTGAARQVSSNITIVKSVGTTARTVDLDYMEMMIQFGTSR
jgi:hypothetical protein